MSEFELSAQILSFRQIERLSDEQILERFAQRLGQIQSAFIEIGKLAVVWKKRHGDKAFKRLQEVLKLKKTTIDNARYTARVWEHFVDTGLINEQEFERLTWNQCVRLDRLLKQGASPGEALEATLNKASPGNDSAVRGQKFENYVAVLLKAKYGNFSWTSPGKLKRYERGLDFIGSFHDPETGLVRRLGVQVKFHRPTDSPVELEWLRFLAGCYLQGVTEALFVTTGKLTAEQLRQAGEARIHVIQGRDEITRMAKRYNLAACPEL